MALQDTDNSTPSPGSCCNEDNAKEIGSVINETDPVWEREKQDYWTIEEAQAAIDEAVDNITAGTFNEADPIWDSEKVNYYTKTEDDSLLAAKATNTGLSNEITARQNADSTLQTNIDTEATARQSADSTLQSNINSEASTRSSADTTLQNNINTEASARQSADNTLQSNIDSEAAARIAGDTAVKVELRDGVVSDGDTLQKLYNLIIGQFSEVTVADITARNLYNVTHLPINVFVVDDGDGNWALYKALTTGVGATYIKISDPDLLNAVITASQIKTAYESNPDTNAFTNALLSKLNGIQTGATANSTDAFLLSRTNHTGTQDASTITGTKTSSFISDFISAVRGTVLTGLDLSVNAVISATDTVLSALGKLQKQITDLTSIVSGKVTGNTAITGATKTKITYDTKGLITGGADATTADIADSTDKRYVTDAQRTVVSNTSGTNSGDETGTRIAALIHAASSKSSFDDSDEVALADSAASFAYKKISWTNIKVSIKAWLDSLTTTFTNKTIENGIHTKGIATSGSTPSIVAGVAAGTSPTISVVGNDIAGVINVTVGTSPSSTSGNVIATISFSATLANVPKIIITPGNNLAGQHVARVFSPQTLVTNAQFTINITGTGGLNASTAYIWNYLVIQ